MRVFLLFPCWFLHPDLGLLPAHGLGPAQAIHGQGARGEPVALANCGMSRSQGLFLRRARRLRHESLVRWERRRSALVIPGFSVGRSLSALLPIGRWEAPRNSWIFRSAKTGRPRRRLRFQGLRSLPGPPAAPRTRVLRLWARSNPRSRSITRVDVYIAYTIITYPRACRPVTHGENSRRYTVLWRTSRECAVDILVQLDYPTPTSIVGPSTHLPQPLRVHPLTVAGPPPG